MSETPKVCECCPNEASKDAPLKLFMTMWMCPSCIAKNQELTTKNEALADERVKAERERASDVISINRILQQTQSIDSSIEVKTDIFNLETVAIVDIKQAIDVDANIPDKNGALAETLLKRFQIYKEKIFANNAENVELAGKQYAIQKYLNTLKNQLTDEQRKKYQLMDAEYKPNQIKISNKPINSPAKPKRFDKAELAKAAARASVPIAVIQMICTAKNMTPMQASDSLLEAGSKKVD